MTPANTTSLGPAAVSGAAATPPGPVTTYWGSPILITEIPLNGIVGDSLAGVGPDGPALEAPPAEAVLDDIEALTVEFLSSFRALRHAHPADIQPPVGGAAIEIQIWRQGHDVPAAGHRADLVGWCFLAASPAPSHSESGALSLFDPRAGSAMTAMPGLPWGRQVMVRPTPGAHLAAPGWLTSSVVPLEAGQFAVVALASSLR